MKFMNVAAKYLAQPMYVVGTSIGQNFFDLLLSNIQPIVLGAILIIGAVLAWKREITKLVGFAVIAIIAVLLVFNTAGVKDKLLEIGNGILGI